LGNACYHSVQNILPSHLLSKNVKIRIYRTLSVVLYGCEMRSLTLREEGTQNEGVWEEGAEDDKRLEETA
jgi:hypothetical protein